MGSGAWKWTDRQTHRENRSELLVDRREVGPDRHTDGSGKGRDGGGVETEGDSQGESPREKGSERRERARLRDRNRERDREQERATQTGVPTGTATGRKTEEQGRPWMTDVRRDGESKTQLEEMNLQKWGREPRQEGGPQSWSGVGTEKEGLREIQTQFCSQTDPSLNPALPPPNWVPWGGRELGLGFLRQQDQQQYNGPFILCRNL